MARSQSPDYDVRKDAIVAAAARLYAAHGFQGTSVADLARECGTSKALIYHYFPSKEDTLYEVMAAHLDALVGAAENELAGTDAQERFRALARSFIGLYVHAQGSHKVLLNELDNLPAERRAEVVAKQRRIISVVAQLVREIQPHATDLALPLSMLFFGMINWTHNWFSINGALNAEQLADLAVEFALNGLTGLHAS